jgi:hypothetical protein
MHTSYSCSIKQSSPLISDGIPEDARELLLSSIGDVVLSPAEKPKSGKSKPVKMNAKQKSGYKFSDADGEYDVPIIDEHMW